MGSDYISSCSLLIFLLLCSSESEMLMLTLYNEMGLRK